VDRNKIAAQLFIALLLLSAINSLTLRSVFASSNSRITLPFHTSWENGDPIGRTDSVDWKKDFYNPLLEAVSPNYVPSDQDSWTETSLINWYGGNNGGPYLSTLSAHGPGSHSIESCSSDTMSDGWGTIGRYVVNPGYPFNAVNYCFLYDPTNHMIQARFDIFLLENDNNYFWRRTFLLTPRLWYPTTFATGPSSDWNITGNPNWDRINEIRIRPVAASAFEVKTYVDYLYFTIDKPRLRVSEFGYDGESNILEASGGFGADYSYCYFNLFDQTSDSDYQPPFSIKPQTFIDIWYYHYQLANSMIDAQLYNKRTGQWTTLRDFNYQGKFIVDQNNVRLHPACRTNDPVNSWQFAAFDLSIIWQSDPGNWFITKIWIGFDNDPQYNPTPVLGQAKTFFDLLSITYGAYGETSHTQGGDNAWASGSLVALDYSHRYDGKYDLRLKATSLGFDNGTWSEIFTTYSVTPQTLRISSVNREDAQVQTNPKPVGLNLTMKNVTATPDSVQKFVYDVLFAVTDIATGVPLGTAIQLGDDVWGLLSSPEPQDFYEWPTVNSSYSYPSNPQRALGEVVIMIPGLSSGTTSVTVNFSVDFGYWYLDFLGTPTFAVKETLPVSVTISWSDPSSFDPPAHNNPPSVSITYPSYDQSFGPGATFTASANVSPPTYYLLNQQTFNGQTGYVFTKLTDSSGQPVGGYDWRLMQCSQRFTETEDEGGTFVYTFNLAGLPVNAYYYLYVQAQATNGANQNANTRIYYYNHPPNTPSQPSGPATGYINNAYSYSASTTDPDNDNIRYEFDWGDTHTFLTGEHVSGVTAWASHTWSTAGTYQVKVRAQDSYGFWSNWSPDLDVTINPRVLGCPTLYIWNGTTYDNFGIIDIHNPEDYDLVKAVYIPAENVSISNYQARFRLREGWEGLNYSHSEIDQVKLYAVINGSSYLCPLVYANHSKLGNVWLKLLFSDNWKVDVYLLETIDLRFFVPYHNITEFIFVIEGRNPLKI